MSTRPRSHLALASALVLAVAGAATAAACGSGGTSAQPGGDAGGDAPVVPMEAGALVGLKSIVVSPSTASVVAGDQATSQSFTAQGTFVDGSTRDVTQLVVWSATPGTLLVANHASVAPAGAIGGDGSMVAASGAISGTAAVHVSLVLGVLGPGAPSSAPGQFGADAGSTNAALAPSIAYPLDGVLVPPNLDPMEIQWQPAAGSALFDVNVSGAALDVHVYTPCQPVLSSGGCSLVPDAKTWSSIVQTLKGGDQAQVVVRAVGAAPGQIGVSPSVSMQFASSDVQGGLYYFNTHTGTLPDGGTEQPGIYRYDFQQNVVGPFFTQQQCAGCHALSKDGTKMLAPICTDLRGCGRPLQLAVVDVASGQFVTPPYPVGDSDTQSWTPDNRYYVTNPTCGSYQTVSPFSCMTDSGGFMQLIDASSNALVAKVPAGAGALFPSFSNDGTRLVYARGATYNSPLSMAASSLYTIGFTEAPAPTWGTESALLTSGGENNYYPSFSPDDAWIIYAQSHCDAGDPASGCDTYDDPTARVFAVSAAGGKAIELTKANGWANATTPPRLTNSWPKWSPFQGQYKGGNIFWVTFSSARDYGFRTPIVGGQPHVRQLWLVGFDLPKAKAGLDPSFAPVWLPFQETTTSNHIGQWTEKTVGTIK